uniref:Uncharacterized protein n=1 Tax=Cannabis sativa TaxID=3483 RepID=A0A803QZ72_CANSA
MFIMLRVPPRRPSRKKTLLMTRTTTLSFARSPRTVGFLYAIGRARSSSTFASTTSRMASKCLARKVLLLHYVFMLFRVLFYLMIFPCFIYPLLSFFYFSTYLCLQVEPRREMN